MIICLDMQDRPKAFWRIAYVSVVFFLSLKHNFMAYRSSKVSSRPDCIFEIHQLWQSGFSREYSNSCCSCSFEPEIIKIGQSSYKMYSNNIMNSQESTTILNAYTKKSGNLLKAPRIYIYIYIYIYNPPSNYRASDNCTLNVFRYRNIFLWSDISAFPRVCWSKSLVRTDCFKPNLLSPSCLFFQSRKKKKKKKNFKYVHLRQVDSVC